jgi:hypothetical protein
MYVERRHRVLPQRRRELAAILTKEIIDKVGVPPASDPDLLLCALYKREYDAQWKIHEKDRSPPIKKPNSPMLTAPRSDR